MADAGPDRTVEQGTVVTLAGGNSTDNVGIVEYIWSFTYDGAPRSLSGMLVTWDFSIPGVYLVVLTVNDAAGLSNTDEVTITVTDTTAPVTSVTFNPEMPPDRKVDKIVQVLFNAPCRRELGTRLCQNESVGIQNAYVVKPRGDDRAADDVL